MIKLFCITSPKNKYKLLLFIFLCSIGLNTSAKMPSAQTLLEKLGVNRQQINSITNGDIVLFDVNSSGETELTAGVIIYLPTQPTQINALIKKDGLASLDPLIISGEIIPLAATPNNFSNFNLHKSANEEFKFLNATPGMQFNLSTQELNLISSSDTKQPDIASTLYRQILWQRWQAYLKNGLKGIDPYDRGDNTFVNPGAELQTAAMAQDPLKLYFPELFNAWQNYPSIAIPIGIEESYTWSNRMVQDRPAGILTHRFIKSESNGELILARQFYAAHSFNANQLMIVCLPYKEGTLVFYTNRTFTDQVSGFGSALKHLIGDNLAKNQVINILKILQKHFE